MSKIAFFYLHGTDPIIPKLLTGLGELLGQVTQPLGLLTVPGLNGLTTTWPDGSPRNDPFINLLDPEIFEPRVKVGYPAVFFPLGLSINIGVQNVIAGIEALPKDQPFMLGGYSQGAAAMSSLYNRLRSGGDLHSLYGSRFKGGVMFGNPRRQQDYRGEVGGTWSGSWDVPNSTTGGRGSFPATGSFARLANCEANKWIEFTAPGDIFSSNGTTTKANNWMAGNATMLDTPLESLLTAIANLPDVVDVMFNPNLGSKVNSFTDAVGRVFDFGGWGHTTYPWLPPEGDPDNGLTSFQIAIKWLVGKATELATAPILLPSTPTSTANAAWSTTLVPPAL